MRLLLAIFTQLIRVQVFQTKLYAIFILDKIQDAKT